MADGVVAGLGQRDAQRRGHLAQEFMRDLHEDARAVAGERVGADGAAMGQIFEDLQTVLDDLAARPAFQIGDEADAAGIVLVLRIVESLRRRRRRPRPKLARTISGHAMTSSHETLYGQRASSKRA